MVESAPDSKPRILLARNAGARSTPLDSTQFGAFATDLSVGRTGQIEHFLTPTAGASRQQAMHAVSSRAVRLQPLS
jgi:hypothetical protein